MGGKQSRHTTPTKKSSTPQKRSSKKLSEKRQSKKRPSSQGSLQENHNPSTSSSESKEKKKISSKKASFLEGSLQENQNLSRSINESKEKKKRPSKRTSSSKGSSSQEHQKASTSSTKPQEKKKSVSVFTALERVRASILIEIGFLRSKNSWAIEDTCKYVSKPLYKLVWDHLHCTLEVLQSPNRHGCKYEDWLQQKEKAAILGVNSNWITPNILAMSRPSDKLVEDQEIIFQFKRYGIGSIFNLQEPGEHAMCSPGIKTITGLSYTPELFMDKSVFYHNYPWRDMQCPSMTFSLDICQVMDSRLSFGHKVAIHCHSGLGRTGLIIACYFMFANICRDYNEAIKVVRESRPQAIQTFNQVQHVRLFEEFLKDIRIIFGHPKYYYRVGQDLQGYMIRQHKYLHGQEARDLRCIPKIVYWITMDLIRRTGYDTDKRQPIAIAFLNELSREFNSIQDTEFLRQVVLVKENLNVGIWNGIDQIDTQVLIHLLMEWLRSLEEPIVQDFILSWALGRGEIEGALHELNRCSKYALATIQILFCWMFQIIPKKARMIRRMYSGLAHILLHKSTLNDGVPDVLPKHLARRRSTISNKSDDVFYTFKPTYLEIEYGLLLEAATRHWIKENKQLNAQTLNARRNSIQKSGITLIDMALENKKLKRPTDSSIFIGEAWLHKRTSLAINLSQDDNLMGAGDTTSYDQAQLNRILESVQKSTPRSRYFHPKRSSCFPHACGKSNHSDNYLPISPRILEQSKSKKKSRSSSIKHVP